MTMKRRDFLKLSATGVASIVIGSKLPFLGVKNAYAAGSQTIEITITDALKDMITHNVINTAQCYFWVYKMKVGGVDIPVDARDRRSTPSRVIPSTISITNTLDEPHSFVIPGMFDSGPIAPKPRSGRSPSPSTSRVHTCITTP